MVPMTWQKVANIVFAAVQHLETYWAILERVKGSTLRLTKYDDEILEHLRKDFPEYDPAEPIDENKMKSAQGKKRWRDFMMAYEKKVDDYSFGTILRKDPKEEYTEHGTIFGSFSACYVVYRTSVGRRLISVLTQCLECNSTPSKLRGIARDSTTGYMKKLKLRKSRNRSSSGNAESI